MVKRRLQVEYYDVRGVPPGSSAPPVPVQRVQRHTEISARNTGQVTTTQKYYSFTATARSSPPRDVVDDVHWNTGSDEPTLDEPISFIDPPTVVDELDATDKNARRPRHLGDHPLKAWIPMIDSFVSEFLRLEGRGDAHNSTACATCTVHDEILYRCHDCFNASSCCGSCTIKAHGQLPTHRIKKWNGCFFEPASLKQLGLVVQLNHVLNEPCLNPSQAFNDDFVILDLDGIHSVALRYCNCHRTVPRPTQLLRSRLFPATVIEPKTAATFRLLEAYQLLSFTSKVSGFEFYQSIARRTDNTGTCPPPDRYRSFMRIVREWRHIRLLKRMGRGHDPIGVAGTRPGECAVLCPACPQTEKNLPEQWENDPQEKQWLHALFVGIDANFRLKRLNVSNNMQDPGLNHGYAYLVDDNRFNAYLKEFGERIPDDVSRCNNHDAIKSASMRGGKGTAVTGVGTVECSRHDMKRPVSVGDLQKGERYVNMDYFFLSSILHDAPSRIVVSYDIALSK
ncbi:hypothetical protein JOM56_014147 [Amanita muscaria]